MLGAHEGAALLSQWRLVLFAGYRTFRSAEKGGDRSLCRHSPNDTVRSLVGSKGGRMFGRGKTTDYDGESLARRAGYRD